MLCRDKRQGGTPVSAVSCHHTVNYLGSIQIINKISQKLVFVEFKTGLVSESFPVQWTGPSPAQHTNHGCLHKEGGALSDTRFHSRMFLVRFGWKGYASKENFSVFIQMVWLLISARAEPRHKNWAFTARPTRLLIGQSSSKTRAPSSLSLDQGSMEFGEGWVGTEYSVEFLMFWCDECSVFPDDKAKRFYFALDKSFLNDASILGDRPISHPRWSHR